MAALGCRACHPNQVRIVGKEFEHRTCECLIGCGAEDCTGAGGIARPLSVPTQRMGSRTGRPSPDDYVSLRDAAHMAGLSRLELRELEKACLAPRRHEVGGTAQMLRADVEEWIASWSAPVGGGAR